MESAAVLGGGSWGTTLAWLLGEKGVSVRLWFRDAEQAREVEGRRENPRYLPGVRLPETVACTPDAGHSVAGADLVVVAVPSGAVAGTLSGCRDALAPGAGVLLASKGLERGTGRRLSEVAAEALGAASENRIAVLSGPNLSAEVVRRIPSASVVASSNHEVARRAQAFLGTPFFRIYTNADVAGVELGGALKNPIAIAAGISDGLGFGANTKASLLTRGLAEMIRLGVAAGARAPTFSGLSGLGDLLATAHSPLSRNYRLGAALGRGESLADALAQLGHVAEGVPTTEAARMLADRFSAEVPILRELFGILFESRPVRDAVASLLARPYRDETGGD